MGTEICGLCGHACIPWKWSEELQKHICQGCDERMKKMDSITGLDYAELEKRVVGDGEMTRLSTQFPKGHPLRIPALYGARGPLKDAAKTGPLSRSKVMKILRKWKERE